MIERVSDRAAAQKLVADLYEAVRHGVFRSLVLAGLDSGRAQEIAHEAFLRLYVELSEGADIRNPRAWVYRVAHNMLMDWLSRNAREVRMPEDVELSMSSREPNAEQALLAKEWSDRVHGALSTQQRLCLELRAQGLQYQEIAEVLQIRPSTVGEFLRRAIRRLKKLNLCDQSR